MTNGAARRSRPELHAHASPRSNGEIHVHFASSRHFQGEDGIDGGTDRNESDDVEVDARRLPHRSASQPGGLQAKSGVIIVKCFQVLSTGSI